MEVFLVPVASDRYEPYCEVEDEPVESSSTEHPPSRWYQPMGHLRRLKHGFSQMLAEAERERRQGRADAPPAGWWARVKARMMRWVAESIAEQRLLWTMRRRTEGTLYFPDDMTEAEAVAFFRKQLNRDFDKHQFWLIIDSIGFIASGLLMLVPGPNLLAYYFGFRLVGHFFSLRGAKQGLRTIAWTHVASRPLAELRGAIHMPPPHREACVTAIAAALGLAHLPKFFDRTAVPVR